MICGPHFLYRCFNADGELIYIGVTNDVENRLRQHSQSSRWWCEMHSYTVDDDCYETRLEIERVERAAIKAELPIYNRRDNPNPPARFEDSQLVSDVLDYVVTHGRLPWEDEKVGGAA